MSQKPQRPFVPHRTPDETRAHTGPVEFRIAPPFVHKETRTSGSDATPAVRIAGSASLPASISDFLAAEPPPPVTNSIPEQPMGSISDFMMTTESPASIADFLAPESSFESTTGASSSDTYDLPPIEHFTDAGDDDGLFGIDEGPAQDPDAFGPAVSEAESESFGWEETDWQRYDWRSAAALGETAMDPEANSAWAQTDWGLGGAPPPAPRDVGESAARAIADALDGIARRIREGDLVLPSSPAAAPDPSTIAATLAALLGVRR